MNIANLYSDFQNEAQTFNITPDMIDYYKKRTNRHISRVKQNAKILESKYPDRFKDLYKQTIKHDFSKFKQPEYLPYIVLTQIHKSKNAGEEYSVSKEVQSLINKATFNHITNNKHHPEYWITNKEILLDKEKRPKVINASNMDMISLGEMCCDHMSMSQELNGDIMSWYNNKLLKKYYFGKDKNNIIKDVYLYLKSQNK